MSVRMIAMDLYRLIKEVDRLEKAFQAASPEKQPKLAEALRQARAERDLLRDMLESRKDVSHTPARKFI